MSDTGFDGQGITAGTELILSLPARFRPRPCSPRPGGECHHRHWIDPVVPGAKNILIS